MNLGNHTPRISLLMRSEFPTTKQGSSKKSITPFQKARKSELKSSKNKSTNAKSPKKSSTQKTLTNEEFRSMLEIKEKVSPTVPSLLGQSLFDLSLYLRPLGDVLDQIKIFKYNAPLHLYRYTSLIKLLSAAVKCPPDATLLLLSIGGRMIKAENYAKPEYLHELIKITQNQISKKYTYESYKDQKEPQKKLLKLLELFKGALTMPQKQPEGTYGTSEIERIMEKEQKEKQMKSPTSSKNESGSPKHKRKRVKMTPLKRSINFDEHDNDNENANENENGFDIDGNSTEFVTTPIRRSTNPKLLPVRTPKTGTPRKFPQSSSKQRKSSKTTPKISQSSNSNLPSNTTADTPKSTKPIKNKMEGTDDILIKPKDSFSDSPPDKTNKKQKEETKEIPPKENEKQQRPFLNIYSDSEPENNNNDDNNTKNEVNKNEENSPLKKSNDPLGQSKIDLDINNMKQNAIDFGKVRKNKVRKSTSTIDVGSILNPNSPKNKKKNQRDVNKFANLPIELDFHSSTLNSSSFLNIIGNAMNDFDDNASQTTTQSGINSISKELRDVLFNDNDSESSEIHSHDEPSKNKNNNDLYLRAKRLATINTYDAADYVDPDNSESNINAKPNINRKNIRMIESSETSSIFKEDDENDDSSFFDRLRSPSETIFASVSSNNSSIENSPIKDTSQNSNVNEDSGFKKMRPAPLDIEENPKTDLDENANDVEEEEEAEKTNDDTKKITPNIDSLSEIPDSIDEEEPFNNKNEVKLKQTKVPHLVLESIQNNLDSENINSPLNSTPSNRLSTNGTSPCSANLSSDYSPGMSTSPRKLDSTGIIDIVEKRPSICLENSNEVHIDIQPDPNTVTITNSIPSSKLTNETNDEDSKLDIDINIEEEKEEKVDANEEEEKIERVDFKTFFDNDNSIDKSEPYKPEWSERKDETSDANNDTNNNTNNNISLSMSKRSKQFWSIEKFLTSKGNIYQRRSRGARLYEDLDQQQVKQISELAKLFTAWNTAYSSSKVVWDVMKNDDKFDIDVLLSQIPISYGDFLIEGLTTFAQNEGIHLKEITRPL